MLATPHVDRALDEAGSEWTDQLSWQAAVNEAVAQSPRNGHLVLAFSDPFMIEVAWGLQAEMLFRGRGDVSLHIEVDNTSFYANERGLLAYAHDMYNRGRPPLPAKGSPGVLTMTANRGGREQSKIVLLTPNEWLWRLIQSPATFYRDRYFSGKVGRLSYRLNHGD
jgi:hypothetical protein